MPATVPVGRSGREQLQQMSGHFPRSVGTWAPVAQAIQRSPRFANGFATARAVFDEQLSARAERLILRGDDLAPQKIPLGCNAVSLQRVSQ